MALTLALPLSARLAMAGEEKSVLEFKVKDIDGKDVNLSDYKGKVILIVNVASKCGLTPQYEGLESLYEKYKDKGLVILGFPANEFGSQEPGTNAEIKQFCTGKYNVTFPMFSKIVVKGEGIHPLYQFLTSDKTNPKYAGEIKWNFNKFLVDRQGNVVARFEPKTTPEECEKTIAEALNAK
jgi:glutathione peroxidase